jgi:hypothetical protein
MRLLFYESAVIVTSRLATRLRWLFVITLVAGLPSAAFAQQILQLDDGSAEDSIGDGITPFLWFNRFTPPAEDYPLTITRIDVVFGRFQVLVGDSVDFYLWEDTDGDADPGTGAVLLGAEGGRIQFNDLASASEYTLTTPVTFETPGDILVGLVNRHGTVRADFPAGIDTGTSQNRSWFGSWLSGDVPSPPTLPADEQWGTTDDSGFPGNWMIRATYEATAVGVESDPRGLPSRKILSSVYPNPFNVETTISYDLPRAAEVVVTVHDILGRQVREVASGGQQAGRYEVTFDATGLPSGVYFYRLEAGDFVETKRMVVAK